MLQKQLVQQMTECLSGFIQNIVVVFDTNYQDFLQQIQTSNNVEIKQASVSNTVNTRKKRPLSTGRGGCRES